MLHFRRFYLAALVAAGLIVSSATSRAVDVRLLPANTEIVVTINIKQILNSELVKSQDEAIKQMKAAIENAPNGDEVLKYFKQMGFDPFTHLVSLTIAHPGSQDPKDLFVVVEGVFDARKFADTAKTAQQNYPDSIKIGEIGKTPYYEITVNGEVGYMALINGKSIVLSAQKEELEGAIQRAKGGKVVAEKVRDLMKTISDKQSFSFVITGEAINRLAQQAPNIPEAAADVIAKTRGLTAAVTLTKEIELMLGVGVLDAKSAREYEQTGTAFLAVAKLFVNGKAKDEPDWAAAADVMRTLRLSSNGSNLLLTASISKENLEKLLKAAGKLRGQFNN